MSRDKPLFLGESYFANGKPPAAYAEVMGESAFLGRTAAAAGVTQFARMLSEGYRPTASPRSTSGSPRGRTPTTTRRGSRTPC